jgi:hypothetical protein
MELKITFNELRKVKDSLPDGAIRKLANEFNVSEETVRNYFGGSNYERGTAVGIHMEPGPNGGIVLLDDSAIFERAQILIAEHAV